MALMNLLTTAWCARKRYSSISNNRPRFNNIFFKVFNIFFVKENEKKHVVHCLRCARQLNKDLTGWICLGEYEDEDMSHEIKNFDKS